MPLPLLTRHYHARPDVVLVPLDGLPDLELATVWRTDDANALIQAFVALTADVKTSARPTRYARSGA